MILLNFLKARDCSDENATYILSIPLLYNNTTPTSVHLDQRHALKFSTSEVLRNSSIAARAARLYSTGAMVLESVVSALLSKYLGDYVDGLSTENLSLGIFSGEVVLENLALKRSALSALHLPVTVKAGYLGMSSPSFPPFRF